MRRDAGMFDVSHMRVVDIAGPDARAFLRYALANNVDKLSVPGKSLYSCLLNRDGGVLDDLIVYFLRDDRFRLGLDRPTSLGGAGVAFATSASQQRLWAASSTAVYRSPVDASV